MCNENCGCKRLDVPIKNFLILAPQKYQDFKGKVMKDKFTFIKYEQCGKEMI